MQTSSKPDKPRGRYRAASLLEFEHTQALSEMTFRATVCFEQGASASAASRLPKARCTNLEIVQVDDRVQWRARLHVLLALLLFLGHLLNNLGDSARVDDTQTARYD